MAYRKIGAIVDSYDWSSEPNVAANIAAQENIHVITITVTESGYYLLDNGQLDVTAAPVVEGICHGTGDCIYTYLRSALHARRQRQGKAITILSCDNLPDNGRQLHAGFTQFLLACDDAELLSWMEKNTAFPNTMVDRITPKIDSEHAIEVQKKFAENDQLTVMSEDFIQWVIEDNYHQPFPPLALVGAEIVNDIEPYKKAKIRILNGAHTIVAYFAALRGYQTYDEAMRDTDLEALFLGYELEEAVPSIGDSPIDLRAYTDTVKKRFSNANIADATVRICSDGASKFSTFILPILKERYENRQSPYYCIQGVASWYVFMRHVNTGSIHVDYNDVKWDSLVPLLDEGAEVAFAECEWIWGDLPVNYPLFIRDLLQAIRVISTQYPLNT